MSVTIGMPRQHIGVGRQFVRAGLAGHAERRRVDQQPGIGKQVLRRRRRMRRDAPRRSGRPARPPAQRVRFVTRMSVKPRSFSAWITALAAPPAPSTTAAPSLRPARRVLVEVRRKAFRVGVAAAKHAVLEPQRVHRADLFGRLVAPGSRGEGRLLVRDRHIAAGKALFAQRREEARRILAAQRRSPHSCRRCRISSASSHGSSASANARSDGRRRRPSSFQPSIAPSSRNSFSSASSGRPTMVKWSPSIFSNSWMPSPSIW